jgi:hypothetical protein
MADIHDISERMPHLSGPAICTECEHKWRAVRVVERDAELMECPSCRKFFGVMRGPQVPDMHWKCNCGSNLFYLTPDGHQCRSCAILSYEWCDD